MKVLSLYCGAGGIDEGLRQAGIKTTLAIDNNKDCIETIKLNHDCEVICGDVAHYLSSLGDYDIIVGGPPCQDFSAANPRRGFDLVQVNLFWDVVRSIRPVYYLMENVPLLATRSKDKQSYKINCADYGTPQKRNRAIWSNIPKPPKIERKSVKDCLGIEGHISPTGFARCNQYQRSTPTNEPCKTILVANKYRLTDKPVYSTKYPQLPQDYTVIRDLTLQELAILQGFPKSYRFYGSNSSIKRQIGNALPPQPVKAIFSQIMVTCT